MKKDIIYILRWIAVLPSAALSSQIVYLFIDYAQSFYADETSKYVIYVLPIISSLGSGVSLISAAVWTAPNYKKQTNFVILILVCLVMGFGIFMKLIEREYLEFSKDIAAVIGTIIGYFVSQEEFT